LSPDEENIIIKVTLWQKETNELLAKEEFAKVRKCSLCIPSGRYA
jgi:hypothetical protein